MDHALSQARRRAVMAIAQQQALVRQEAEKQLAELGAAMNDLLSLYTSAAKLGGDGWAFAQNQLGEIVLRQTVPEKPAESEESSKGEST